MRILVTSKRREENLEPLQLSSDERPDLRAGESKPLQFPYFDTGVNYQAMFQ
jgi:hypothetical protein